MRQRSFGTRLWLMNENFYLKKFNKAQTILKSDPHLYLWQLKVVYNCSNQDVISEIE